MISETVVDEVFIERMDVYRLPDKSKGLLEACSGDFVLFCEFMLGVPLRAWQVFFAKKLQDSVNGVSRQRDFAALTSRQVGKSWLVAMFALWLLTFNKYSGGGKHGNTQIGVVSASDNQAKKLLREIKKFIWIGDKFMHDQYNGEFDAGTEREPIMFFSSLLDVHQPNNTTTVTFRAHKPSEHGKFLLCDSIIGSYVVSLPPTSGILGYTFSLLLVDEAGHSQSISDEFFIDMASPTTDELDAITIYTSTPWQPSGRFYEVVKEASLGLSSFDIVKFTIDCVRLESPDKYESVLEKIESWNRSGLSDSVRRSYYCEFVKGESSYFNPENVKSLFDDEEVSLTEFSGECDMGVDFGGQVKSKTVITISYLDDDDIVHRIYHKVYDVGKDLSLLDDIEELLARFNVQRIIPDDCPAGDHLIRKMIEEKGWNVHPMNFRRDKVKKYGAFRRMMNKGVILSYEDDTLLTEMLAIEYSQGSKQSVIIAPPGYTDDRIDSFVMSCYFFIEDDVQSFKVYEL